jgi:hypothetical protein
MAPMALGYDRALLASINGVGNQMGVGYMHYHFFGIPPFACDRPSFTPFDRQDNLASRA